jgi:photosystem II stability/assembly factor-like uncharacterized protein
MRKNTRIKYVSALSLLAIFIGVPPIRAAQPQATVRVSPDTAVDSIFAGMKYRLVGPFRGGRATAVSGVAQQPDVYYFGSAAGGVWKTTDSGTTWKPLWDHFPQASPSIGALAVAPSDPNTIYVGTGEANIRSDVVTGNGMYKSTDGGKTWESIGLSDSEAIGRLAVNPTDANTVLVAALGHPFGPNSERGIFRTRDGGKTWQRVLHVDDKTGGIDVQYDPDDPSIVYAAMLRTVRRPWIFESGGGSSGLYRSNDGGTTWQKLTGHGLPAGMWGRIGIAPTSNPQRVYALIDANNGGLYRTDDGGASWKLINSNELYREAAFYFMGLFADPKDPDKVYIMNGDAYESKDGGRTFKTMPTFHSDNHSLWVNPRNTDLMVNANDGGADISFDGGSTWTTEMNQPTAEFYRLAVDNQVPYHLYGSQQDNTTVDIASADLDGPISEQDWHSVGGGESGYVAPKPDDPNIVIAGWYVGYVSRYDHRTGEIDPINPWARQVMGWAPKDLLHRAPWTAPIAFSPHDANVLYYGAEVLFESTDLGQSWRIISPDLTRNDKSKQLPSGGPLTREDMGLETYDTISSVAESPLQKGLVWVGTDDGLIQLTADGGGHWRNVTPGSMPRWGTVDTVEADPHEASTAYIAVDCHRLDDFGAHAFRTHDFGKTWVSITHGIPDGSFIHAIRVDPTRAGLLYAATETGIFVSFDDGTHWQSLQLNLPRVPVEDIAVHDGDLALATHGRAFWVLDDLSPIRQWSDGIRDQAFHLFEPRPARRILYSDEGESTGEPGGANPPAGVLVDYYTSHSSKRVQVAILDAAGQVIRTLSAPGIAAHAGLNQFVWDMRYDGAPSMPKPWLWLVSLQGPVALPGRYEVRLTVDGTSETQSFEIIPDPRLHVTQAQLQEQFDVDMAIRAQLRRVQKAILQMRSLHARLGSVRHAVVQGKIARGPRILRVADALERKTAAAQETLIQPAPMPGKEPLVLPVRLQDMLGSLNALVESSSSAPTQADKAELHELTAMTTTDLEKWDRIKRIDLPVLNALLVRSGQPAITLN